MGNCFRKQNYKSVVKLTCPYCNNFNTFNTKDFEDHIDKCIELDKYFSFKNYE